jgi:hypothetical protein
VNLFNSQQQIKAKTVSAASAVYRALVSIIILKGICMARKIIQIVSDNFFDPNHGQYCGLLALCDDGTIWSGHTSGSGIEWCGLNAP